MRHSKSPAMLIGISSLKFIFLKLKNSLSDPIIAKDFKETKQSHLLKNSFI